MKKYLDLKDVVKVLCHYDLIHTEFPHNKLAPYSKGIPMLHGLACDSDRKIYIASNIPYENMRETVLHELMHCRDYLTGKKDGISAAATEKLVHAESSELIKILFGKGGK